MNAALKIIDIVTTKDGKSYAPAGRMAAAITDIVSANGDCDVNDLRHSGMFSDKGIREHWHMAYSLAMVELSLSADNDQMAGHA